MSPYLLSLVFSILCLGAFLARVGEHPFDASAWYRRVWASFLLGLTIGAFVVPVIYTTIGFALLGAPLEQRLFPGTSIDYLLFWLAAAALASLAYAFEGYARVWRQ